MIGLKWINLFSPLPLPQKLINVSSEVMNIHIIPTQTKHFQTSYTKKVLLKKKKKKSHYKLLTWIKYCESSYLLVESVLFLKTQPCAICLSLKYRLIPGLAYALKVRFCPDEWRYFYDCIRVHCKVRIHQFVRGPLQRTNTVCLTPTSLKDRHSVKSCWMSPLVSVIFFPLYYTFSPCLFNPTPLFLLRGKRTC